MNKRKITVIALAGVCFVGFILSNSGLIQVVSSSQDYVMHIVYAVETGTIVLFYVFFTKGVNPDCIELIPDECFDNLQLPKNA